MQSGSDRSVDAHIEGTVTGQIAVGENIVQTGDVNGDVVLSVALAELPVPQPHPSPVVVRPRPFAGLLDRQEEIQQVSQALQAEQPIGLCAEEGMGKSALLRRIAYLSEADAFPDGVVYISALYLQEADLRQELFNAFYECKVPTKPTDAQIQHALQEKRALILLDDVAVSRGEAEALMSMAPQCTFLLASEERLLWGEGCGIPLRGLPPEAALALVVRELGRPLSPDELPQARAICEALKGHPLRIIQAAAVVREEKRSFAALAVAARSPEPARSLTASLVGTLSEPQRRVLFALGALDGAPTGAGHIAAISENEDAAADLEALQRLNVVQEHGLQYRLTRLPAAALPEAPDMAPWVGRALNHFAAWGERLRGSPRAILGEVAAILVLINRGAAMEQWGEVLRLVKVAEGPLTLAGRWQAWETVLQQGLAAARALGDRGAEAWALHQAGVRALSLGDKSRAQELLRRAFDIRRSIGDQTGAALTKQNLDIASGAAPPPAVEPSEAVVPTSAVVKAAALKVLAVLLVLGGGGYLLFRAWSPPKLTELQVRPAVVDGGGFSKLTIGLDKPARAGGVEVKLASSDNAVEVPEHMQVLEGSRTGSLLIKTGPVQANTRVTITAAQGESLLKAVSLEVRPVVELVQLHLTLAPETVMGGSRARGTVELSKPAASEGLAAVQTSEASIVRAPPSVTVPAGAARMSFDLDTKAVTRATPVTVTVSYAGVSESAELRLQPRPAQLAAIAFDRPTITAGEQVGGVVTLSGPAPEGGAVVSLSPSSGVVRVGSPLTVLEGKTSARFEATASRVSQRSMVRVTASLSGSQSKGAALTIEPEGPELAAVTVTPTQVVGGEPARAVVRLARAAPRDITVRLSSSTPAVAAPETVKIGRGEREAGVALKTTPGARPVEAVITASYGSFTKSARLRLLPVRVTLAGLSLERARVAGGGTVTGTVTLSGRAPEDTTVALSASHSAARPQKQVTVPAGDSSVQFPVQTVEVERPVTARITATWGGTSKSASLRIEAVPARLETIVARPSEVRGGAHIGVMVRLDRAVPEAVEVPLSSDRREVTVPETVRIEQGQREGTVAAATQEVRGTVTATITASYGGVTKSDRVRVLGAAPRVELSGLSVDPTRVQAGGAATGTVTLSDSAPGDMAIDLSASSRAVRLPKQVTVRAGRRSAEFPVQISPKLPGVPTVTISAALGSITKTASLTIESRAAEVELSGLSLDPSSVQAGGATTGTVTLSNPAPSDVAVALSAKSRAVRLPKQVTVRAGRRSAEFPVQISSQAPSATVTIAATLGSITKTASLTIERRPAEVELSGLSVNPTSVEGGKTVTGTVTLSGNTPADVSIGLFADSRVVGISGSVTVRAGTSSRDFTVETGAVTSPQTVTITAAWRSVQRRAQLTVTPAGRAPGPEIHLESVTVTPSEFSAGGKAKGTVRLTAKVTQPTVVFVSSNRKEVRVSPTIVPILSGRQEGSFAVSTRGVRAPVTAIITAVYGQEKQTARVEVHPTDEGREPVSEVYLKALTLAPENAGSGDTITGTIMLTGPAPAGGAAVTLKAVLSAVRAGSSAAPSDADSSFSAFTLVELLPQVACPSPVVVPAGQSQESFTFRVPQISAEGTYKIVVTAGYRGRQVSDSVTVTVLR